MNKLNTENIKFNSDRCRIIFDGMVSIFRHHRIWRTLAIQDIKLKYRRSKLGPFWITISLMLTIYSMGFLYGGLFKMDLRYYFPFLALGVLSWNFINSMINESTVAFISAAGYLGQIKLPFTVFLMRVILRNLIILAHNFIAVIPILIFCCSISFFHVILFIFGVIIICINGLGYGLILATFGTRFRDVAQIITNFMQIIFFVTPIMWSPKILPARYSFVTKFNPFLYYIDIVRDPLMNITPNTTSYVITIGFALIGLLFGFLLLRKVFHRIIYWL